MTGFSGLRNTGHPKYRKSGIAEGIRGCYAEWKALLTNARPAFVDHLEHAKQIQAQLGKKGYRY